MVSKRAWFSMALSLVVVFLSVSLHAQTVPTFTRDAGWSKARNASGIETMQDFDFDGVQDLIYRSGTHSIEVFSGSNGNLITAMSFSTQSFSMLPTGDFDNDSRPDLLVDAGNGLVQNFSIATGQLIISTSTNASRVALIRPLLNYEYADYVASNFSTGTVDVYLGVANAPIFSWAWPFGANSLANVFFRSVDKDVDGDSWNDLVALDFSASVPVSHLISTLTGSILASYSNATILGGLGDINQDGKAEYVVIRHSPSNQAEVRDGANHQTLHFVSQPFASYSLIDVDSDGVRDILGSFAGSLSTSVTAIAGQTGLPIATSVLPGSISDSFVSLDGNRDGYPELISFAWNGSSYNLNSSHFFGERVISQGISFPMSVQYQSGPIGNAFSQSTLTFSGGMPNGPCVIGLSRAKVSMSPSLPIGIDLSQPLIPGQPTFYIPCDAQGAIVLPMGLAVPTFTQFGTVFYTQAVSLNAGGQLIFSPVSELVLTADF